MLPAPVEAELMTMVPLWSVAVAEARKALMAAAASAASRMLTVSGIVCGAPPC